MKTRWAAIILTFLICACSVQIYDLQPLMPTETVMIRRNTPTLYIPIATEAPFVHAAATAEPIAAPTEIVSAISAEILELTMIDGGTGWGIGQIPGEEARMILRTTDGGSSWKDLTPRTALEENKGRTVNVSAYFSDANHAWVIYWEPVSWQPDKGVQVWLTADAGANWERIELPISGYTLQYFRNPEIGFTDNQIGWIFAKLGNSEGRTFYGLYTTFDGGRNWNPVVTPDTGNLSSANIRNGAVFRDALEGWISGENNFEDPSSMLWHTQDGGATWVTQTLPVPEIEGIPADIFSASNYSCSLSTPKFVDFQYQYAYTVLNCEGGELEEPVSVLYWSYDSLSTWRTKKLPKAEGNLTFYGIDRGWYSVTADPGADQPYEILTTVDGGDSWNVSAYPAWDSRLQFITAAVGFGVVNYQGHLALVRTGDGGVSWNQLYPLILP